MTLELSEVRKAAFVSLPAKVVGISYARGKKACIPPDRGPHIMREFLQEL